jgi:nucleotide-binding universal stress UspA family protein
VDDSPGSQLVLRWCVQLARRLGAPVEVVHAVSRLSLWVLAALQIDTTPTLRRRKAKLRGPWTGALRDAGVPYQTWFMLGNSAHELERVAAQHASPLIVVGTTSHRSGETTLGSTARRLTHHAHYPIVLVPPADRQLMP